MSGEFPIPGGSLGYFHHIVEMPLNPNPRFPSLSFKTQLLPQASKPNIFILIKKSSATGNHFPGHFHLGSSRSRGNELKIILISQEFPLLGKSEELFQCCCAGTTTDLGKMGRGFIGIKPQRHPRPSPFHNSGYSGNCLVQP